MKLFFERVDPGSVDLGKRFELELKSSEGSEDRLVLGRGPLLEIDSTAISREQAALYWREARLWVKVITKKISVRRSGGGDEELAKNDELELRENDELRFSPTAFHFRLQEIHSPPAVVIAPTQSTGVWAKKRKLPDWIEASGGETSPIAGKRQKEKTPTKKEDEGKLSPQKENVSESRKENGAGTNKENRPGGSNSVIANHSVTLMPILPGEGLKQNKKQTSSPRKSRLKANLYVADSPSTSVADTSPAEVSSPVAASAPSGAASPTAASSPTAGAVSSTAAVSPAAVSPTAGAVSSTAAVSPTAASSPLVATSPAAAALSSTAASSQAATGGTSADLDDSPTVFPVLVTKEDLMDSEDEEQEKRKKKGGRMVAAPRPRRVSCQFGGSCYRKNPQHFEEEAHPGDSDYRDPTDVADAGEEEDERPECEFGLKCYRKNPQHRRDYKHTRKPQPRRRAKAAKKKKATAADGDDEYESDFIDDDSDDFDPVDDSDADENWKLTSDEDD